MAVYTAWGDTEKNPSSRSSQLSRVSCGGGKSGRVTKVTQHMVPWLSPRVSGPAFCPPNSYPYCSTHLRRTTPSPPKHDQDDKSGQTVAWKGEVERKVGPLTIGMRLRLSTDRRRRLMRLKHS